MRPRLSRSFNSGLLTIPLAALTIAGCAQPAPIPTREIGVTPSTQPSETGGGATAVARSKGSDTVDPIARQAEEAAAKMSAALAQEGAAPGPTDPDAPTAAGPRPTPERDAEVRWIDPQARRTKPKQPSQVTAEAPAPPQANAAPPAKPTASASDASKDAAAAAPAPADRQQLLSKLLEDIRGSRDPAMAKALSATALALLDPSSDIEAADLSGLSPQQRDEVKRFHRAVAALARDMAAGKTATTREELLASLEKSLGEQPLRMRNVQLCRKVNGYGVYEAFEGNTFLAGRDQPMIVYVELDNFRSAKAADGQYQVKLTQEITLYSEADGLAVWRQPTAEIVDQSRNRRNDFFVVQLVRLPARLGTGKYRLKVRLSDVNGGSVDEAGVALQFVADQSLVSSNPTKR